MLRMVLIFFCCLAGGRCPAQGARWAVELDAFPTPLALWAKGPSPIRAYVQTAALLDAALTSLNSLQSLVRKDNYRNRVSALNNPASAELGFSLEAEIQSALRPILDKTKSVNTNKFSEVISSFINNPGKGGSQNILPLFPALAGLVGNLAIQEKRVTRADVDSFLQQVGRYFAPYEKLQAANDRFESEIERLQRRLVDLQFDIREYTLDLVLLLHPKNTRTGLKERTLEELLLQYLDPAVLEGIDTARGLPSYPTDALRGGKDISATVQKLFREYQGIVQANYNEIRTILSAAKPLSKGGAAAVDASLKNLEECYQQSIQADALNLRIGTLSGRLQALSQSVQALAGGR